jgi:hypothetical protein
MSYLLTEYVRIYHDLSFFYYVLLLQESEKK